MPRKLERLGNTISTIGLVFGLTASFAASAFAQVNSTIPHPPVDVTFDITDFVTILEWVFGFLTILLAIFAGLCVAFFGIDIKKAQDKLVSILKESNQIFDKLKIEYQEQQSLIIKKQNELNDTLRQARDLLEKLKDETTEANDAGMVLEELQQPTVNPPQPMASSASIVPISDDIKRERIRDLIRTSKYEWTTIGRLEKGTGLDPAEIRRLVLDMQDIQTGKGRKTKDTIFKFR